MTDLKDLIKNPAYMAHLAEHNRKEMRERTRQLLGVDYATGGPSYTVKVRWKVTPVRSAEGIKLVMEDMVIE